MYSERSEREKAEYRKGIETLCSLSNLFSTSDKPYLDYRLAEQIVCKCLRATDHTRSDIAFDASKDGVGIGIKTFVGGMSQKIAEFDAEADLFNTGNIEDDLRVVSELRNKRIDVAHRICGTDDCIYHIIYRDVGVARIHEFPMDYIDVDRIRITKQSSLGFTDGLRNYRLYRAKSTLYEELPIGDPLEIIPVKILDNPLDILLGSVGEYNIESHEVYEELVVPLYSSNKLGDFVAEKSGLNQGFAGGRKRDPDEVYIPYPKKLRDANPGFFPERYVPFTLRLPDGSEMSAAVCQDDGKALTSNPNKALGKWILRDILGVPYGKPVTMDMLEYTGVKALKFTKISQSVFDVDVV